MHAVLDHESQEDAVAAADMDAKEKELQREMAGLVRQVGVVERKAREARAELDAAGDSPSLALIGKVEDIEQDFRDALRAAYRMVAHATGWVYMPAEVESWYERAVDMGACRPQLGKAIVSDLLRHRKVPNARFRERIMERLGKGESMHSIGFTFWQHLCALEGEMGVDLGSRSLVRKDGDEVNCDTSRFSRLLGIVTKPEGDRLPSVRLYISYEHAVALARALDMSPLEAGV